MTFTLKELVLEYYLVVNVTWSSVACSRMSIDLGRLQSSCSVRPVGQSPACEHSPRNTQSMAWSLCSVEELPCSSHCNQQSGFVCTIVGRDPELQECRQSLHCLQQRNRARISQSYLELRWYPRRWDLYFPTMKKT